MVNRNGPKLVDQNGPVLSHRALLDQLCDGGRFSRPKKPDDQICRNSLTFFPRHILTRFTRTSAAAVVFILHKRMLISASNQITSPTFDEKAHVTANAADSRIRRSIVSRLSVVRVRVFGVLIFSFQLDRRHWVIQMLPRRRAELVFVVGKQALVQHLRHMFLICLLYTSPSPRDS